MDDDQQFCLRWNNHQSTLISVFDTLLEKGIHVDCTLAAEGQTLKAHKVVLSACSPYFESVLSQQYDKHPIIILKDVKFAELRAMMDYMYRGEVNISQDQLGALLKAAESLQIKGLSDSKPPPAPSNPPHPRPVTPPPKVRSVRASPGGDIDEGSREGSISPSRRKRKKRRTSLSPLPPHPLTHAVTLPVPAPLPPAPLNHAAVALPLTLPRSNHSPQPVLNNSAQVTLAPPPPAGVPVPLPIPAADTISEENDTMAKIKRIQFGNEPVAKAKLDIDVDIPAVVRPKAEYSDDGMEESVEDLTLDEEADSDGDGDGELEHSGYPWPLDRSQDESITGQDGHRDSQGAADAPPAADVQMTRRARLLLREAILQNNNVVAKEEDAKDPHKAEADSDTEFDDTDDILLPDESEVFGPAPVKEEEDDGKYPRSEAGEGDGEGEGEGQPRHFECRHCGKRYRWKSTLRRHESVECGGKPPAHACPYCPYRAKQRGNLGVHVRKHHNNEWTLFADTKLRKTKKARHSM